MIALALLLLAQPHPLTITFKLAQPADSSCGVFTESGRLVRTLWGNRQLKPMGYKVTWDGRDDRGNAPPAGPYVAKLLLHNLTAKWEGTIGNSSRYFTATSKLRGLGGFADLTFVGNTGYLFRRYNEGGEYIDRFPLAKPDTFAWVGLANDNFRYIPRCFATDGKTMFVGAARNDQNGAVHACGIYGFPLNGSGPNVQFSGLPPVDGLESGGNDGGRLLVLGSGYRADLAIPTALAVQHHGDLLAVAIRQAGVVRFYDKRTGEQSGKDIDVEGLGPIQFSPDDETLWAGSGRTVAKCDTHSRSLETAFTFEAGVVSALAVDGRNGDVAALTDAPTPKVTCFDPKTQKSLWTVGSSQSYAESPEVTDSKFMMLPPDPAHQPVSGGIAFDPFGALWVVDEGNQRVLRFAHPAVDPTSADKTICMLTGYTMAVDRNDPSRVFSGYLEFHRDWGQKLTPGLDGGWKLVRNWGSGRLDRTVATNPTDGLTDVVTHDGHTYGILCPASEPNQRYFAELTGVGLETRRKFEDNSLDADLNAWRLTLARGQDRAFIAKRPLVAVNNGAAIWGDGEEFSSAPLGPREPIYDGGYSFSGGMPVEATADGVVPTFNTTVPGSVGTYYLGLTHRGDHDYFAKTALGAMGVPLTHDGKLPVGPPSPNEIPCIGGKVCDDLIAIFANGEGFDQGEADQILFYHSSGLPLIDFGTRGGNTGGLQAPGSGRSGNFYGAAFFRTNDDLVHLLHTDESVHGGIHEIAISGEGTIAISSAPFVDGVAALGQVAPKQGGRLQASPDLASSYRDDWHRSLAGWSNPSGLFSIEGGQLRVARQAFAAWDRALLLRPSEAEDTQLSIDIPAQTFDRDRMYVDPNGWEADWELVSRAQTDGNRYFLQLRYFRPLHPGPAEAGGVLYFQMGLVVGGQRFGLAFDRAIDLPVEPHGYHLSFTTVGTKMTRLRGEVTDSATDKRLMMLEQLSDQPELQQAGRFGLAGGMGNNAFDAFLAHFGP